MKGLGRAELPHLCPGSTDVKGKVPDRRRKEGRAASELGTLGREGNGGDIWGASAG